MNAPWEQSIMMTFNARAQIFWQLLSELKIPKILTWHRCTLLWLVKYHKALCQVCKNFIITWNDVVQTERIRRNASSHYAKCYSSKDLLSSRGGLEIDLHVEGNIHSLSTAVLSKPTSRVARGRWENLARILGGGPAGVARAGPGSGAPAPRAPTFRPSRKRGVPGSRPRAESTPTCCARVKQTFPEPGRKNGPHWPLGSARAQLSFSSVGSGPFAHNT